jgi:hypothetical protein
MGGGSTGDAVSKKGCRQMLDGGKRYHNLQLQQLAAGGSGIKMGTDHAMPGQETIPKYTFGQ